MIQLQSWKENRYWKIETDLDSVPIPDEEQNLSKDDIEDYKPELPSTLQSKSKTSAATLLRKTNISIKKAP